MRRWVWPPRRITSTLGRLGLAAVLAMPLLADPGPVHADTPGMAFSVTCAPPTAGFCSPGVFVGAPTDGTLRVYYTASAGHCEPIDVSITVDGGAKGLTLLANPGETVMADLSPVGRGLHNVELQAGFVNNACGSPDGLLHSWAGVVSVETTDLTFDQKSAAASASNTMLTIADGCGIAGLIGVPAGPLDTPFFLCGAGFGAAGLMLQQEAKDPADPNFTVIAQPTVHTLRQQPFTTAAGLTQAEADALTALATNLDQQIALEQAMFTSINRASGAINMQDMAWQARQRAAAHQYAALLAPLEAATPDLLKTVQTALLADPGYKPRTVTTADASSFIGSLRQGVIPGILAQALTDWGLDAAGQTATIQAMGSVDPAAVAALSGGQLPQMLTDPTVTAAFQQAAQMHAQYGQSSVIGATDTLPPMLNTPLVLPSPTVNGWNNGPVTVTLGATDHPGGGGVQSIVLEATGAQVVAPSVVVGSSTQVAISAEGVTALTYTATNSGGNSATPQTLLVKIDKTPPTATATAVPGTPPKGLPLITVTGTAIIRDPTGTMVGTEAFTCFDTRGLNLSLATSDSSNGSGVASLTYAATGAQPMLSTAVTSSTAQVSITAPGLTTLTYAAKDVAGNQTTVTSESIIVGVGLACAGPTPTFSLPSHGTLAVTGTATSNSQSYPFNQTTPF